MLGSSANERSAGDSPGPDRPADAQRITPAAVALAFSALPLDAEARALANAVVAAARSLLGAARLVLPPTPVPIAVGDGAEGLELLLRFTAPGGEAELWAPPVELSPEARATLAEQLVRSWSVQRERGTTRTEVDNLRFRLDALQQVTHTLAEVREIEDTERIALDFIREISLSWWAALYRTDPAGGYLHRAAMTAKEQAFAERLPDEAVHPLLPPTAGRPVRCTPDSSVSEYLPADTALLAPLRLDAAGSGLLALGPRVSDAPYTGQDLSLLQALVDATAIALRNAELIEHLRTQAIRDALTGCQNRRGFDEILATEVARARRYERPLALVVLDLDHFKHLNDRFGHAAGDQALRRVGQLMLTQFRASDIPCRPGGEEFALIFPETHKAGAMRLAERLRASIQAMSADAGQGGPLTASFGVAAYPDDADSVDELVRAADRALYRAKSGGRNRIAVAGDG